MDYKDANNATLHVLIVQLIKIIALHVILDFMLTKHFANKFAAMEYSSIWHVTMETYSMEMAVTLLVLYKIILHV
jgi:hypothetical protein